jgi:hypothetical protein
VHYAGNNCGRVLVYPLLGKHSYKDCCWLTALIMKHSQLTAAGIMGVLNIVLFF